MKRNIDNYEKECSATVVEVEQYVGVSGFSMIATPVICFHGSIYILDLLCYVIVRLWRWYVWRIQWHLWRRIWG